MTQKEKYIARLKRYHGQQRGGDIEGFGKKMNASKWAKELGLGRTTVWRYLKNGLTIEEIVEIRGINYQGGDAKC